MRTDPYPKIYIDQTDQSLPESIKNYEKYQYFSLLARGGSATIMTCQDTILNRKVAYKSLHKEVKKIEVEQKRFLREARVTAMLQHPNTPPVYELGRDKHGDPYFTMKLILGRTLKNIIEELVENDRKTKEEFTLNRLLGALIQVSNAIAYAHEHGVIHRDIKPGNIQIGAFGEVLMLDWGLAKVWGMPPDEEVDQHMTQKKEDLELTRVGKRQGTPLYMSPEQALGVSDIDERTDIFSLGSVLYEMLTLKNMFVGKSVHELLNKLKHDDPIIPSERNPNRLVPKRLEEICLKAIQRDRDKRYQDVMDFVNNIREFRQESLESSEAN